MALDRDVQRTLVKLSATEWHQNAFADYFQNLNATPELFLQLCFRYFGPHFISGGEFDRSNKVGTFFKRFGCLPQMFSLGELKDGQVAQMFDDFIQNGFYQPANWPRIDQNRLISCKSSYWPSGFPPFEIGSANMEEDEHSYKQADLMELLNKILTEFDDGVAQPVKHLIGKLNRSENTEAAPSVLDVQNMKSVICLHLTFAEDCSRIRHLLLGYSNSYYRLIVPLVQQFVSSISDSVGYQEIYIRTAFSLLARISVIFDPYRQANSEQRTILVTEWINYLKNCNYFGPRFLIDPTFVGRLINAEHGSPSLYNERGLSERSFTYRRHNYLAFLKRVLVLPQIAQLSKGLLLEKFVYSMMNPSSNLVKPVKVQNDIIWYFLIITEAKKTIADMHKSCNTNSDRDLGPRPEDVESDDDGEEVIEPDFDNQDLPNSSTSSRVNVPMVNPVPTDASRKMP